MCRKYNSSIDDLTAISYNADKAYSFYESGIKDCIFILSYMHLSVGQKEALLIFRKSMLYHFTLFYNNRQGLFGTLMDFRYSIDGWAFGFSEGFCGQRRNRMNNTYVKQKLDELHLIDDFLFFQMMNHPKYGPKFSRLLLRLILGRDVGKLHVIPQKEY